jgi:glycerol kinase
MPERFILAVDQGTTNTKAIAIDETGSVLARAARPVATSFPQPAWVEQSPEAIWDSVRAAAGECLRALHPRRPEAIGISNQRETVLLWNRLTGEPLGPAVIWQCRRTAEFCQTLKPQEAFLRQRTGLTVDPLFSASKGRWLWDAARSANPLLDPEHVCLGTIDSWLIWKLTGGKAHVTDVSNASRTQLLNLATTEWDPELINLFGIPSAILPRICPSAGILAETVEHEGVPAGLPIASAIGDSHAALFGQRVFRPGSVKATYGTGTSLMTPIERPQISEQGLSTTVAWSLLQVQYALEGNISVTGAAVDWFGKFLGASDSAAKVTELAFSVPDTGGVYLVPAFVGLGAPYWDETARGLVSGLTRGTGPGHVARAVLESIAYQIRAVFDVMQTESGGALHALLADGGAASNDRLMQFQADILGCPVLRNTASDLSALGAAFLAGIGVGIWPTLEQLADLPVSFDRFEPQMPEAEREEHYAGWEQAVRRARA